MATGPHMFVENFQSPMGVKTELKKRYFCKRGAQAQINFVTFKI